MMRAAMTRALSVALGGLMLIACAQANTPVLEVCYGFGCKASEFFQPTAEEWRAVEDAFEPEPASAAEERERIRIAVALLETISGRYMRISEDVAGNYPGFDSDYQTDCIDESTNTTTYLKAIERDGLLHYHVVQARKLRNYLLFFPHWTAVIEDKKDGQRYAVDSWYTDNGEPPFVQVIEDWVKRRPFPEQPLSVIPRELLCQASE
jgi:hypothetical protein